MTTYQVEATTGGRLRWTCECGTRDDAYLVVTNRSLSKAIGHGPGTGTGPATWEVVCPNCAGPWHRPPEAQTVTLPSVSSALAVDLPRWRSLTNWPEVTSAISDAFMKAQADRRRSA